MHCQFAMSRHVRGTLRIALLVGVIASVSSARASAQGARDVDSTSLAPGVRVPATLRGASRAVVDSGDVRRAAALTFSELLQARAASVDVMMRGGRQIDGGQLQIRGPSTLGTNGAPLFIVDGIRMDEREDDDIGTTSRLDDVAIDDIATVEVLRGPSAATLYGSGASSGVIVVTTKRGQQGWAAHLRTTSEALQDGTAYAERYRRRVAGSPYIGSCSLELEAAGQCVPGQVDRWRPIGDAGLNRTGIGALAGFDVAGGTAYQDARLSLSLRRGLGISTGDALSRLSTRLNATQRFGKSVELTGHASYVGDRTEDSKFGEVIDGQGRQSVGATPVDSFARWAATRLGTAMGARLDHLTTGIDLAVRPMSRLTLRAALSRDRVTEGAGYASAPSQAPDNRVSGWSANRETRVTGEYVMPLSGEIGTELLLVAGSEREHRERQEEEGAGAGGYEYQSSRYWIGGVNDAQFAIARLQQGDRFAASFGVRRERDGLVAGNAYRTHPVTELAFHPTTALLGGDLRLRAAYGESTQRLATFVGFPEFYTYPPYFGNFYGYLRAPSAPTSPETMQEGEGGVDLGWGSRGAISLTGYHRSLKNVLLPSWTQQLPGGYAPPPPAVALTSYGVEADARVRVVERGSMRWTLRAIVATNRNRVTTPNIETFSAVDGVTSNQAVGVAERNVPMFSDANGNGVAETSELGWGNPEVLNSGGSTPTLTTALHSELALGRRLTLGVIVDRRSGAWTLSSVARTECAWPQETCRELQDPATPLAVQAKALENRFGYENNNTFDASFTRLREVSARWTLPVSRTTALGATGARVMIAGRDLATWTRWPGTDPEISSRRRATLTRDDGSAVPLPRRLIVGLEFDY
jgi:TonB-dependent SusC/RagA subfamily outer membrane receptor